MAEESNEQVLIEEVRLLRQQVEQTNRILVSRGVKVHVFWKIAWGIIMAGILLALLSVAWGLLMGATMLAGLLAGAADEQDDGSTLPPAASAWPATTQETPADSTRLPDGEPGL